MVVITTTNIANNYYLLSPPIRFYITGQGFNDVKHEDEYRYKYTYTWLAYLSLSLGGGGEGFSLHGIAEWISFNAFKRLGVSITVKID